jgi:protein-tyrosine phosphatase
MDGRNYADLRAIAGCADRARVRMMMEFAGECPVSEVPDPYTGGDDGFDRVLDLLELSVAGLGRHIAARNE